ncbi:hypothetical protein KUCAC02_033582 [Chaenocephalus aceratus]|nr:hypothetical protein KUCAC02_033582 [Chaenocephalus aceratus]
MAASAATASSSPGLLSKLRRDLLFPGALRSSFQSCSLIFTFKLLRKSANLCQRTDGEKYLLKVCQELNPTWAWELEQNGYKDLSTECKTGILKYLCECQFDDNVKFKTAINEEDPDKMRLQPIGRDKDGQMYWFQLDQSDNVRLYIEEQTTWTDPPGSASSKTETTLAEVVALLKTQIDPALLKRDEEIKAAVKSKKIEDSSDEDIKDKAAGQVSPKTENNEEETENNEKETENNEESNRERRLLNQKRL